MPYALFTGWDYYRIGDMISYKAIRDEPYCPNSPTCGQWHCDHWPTSLACRYLQNTTAENDFATLAAIIRTSYTDPSYTPPRDAVVVHLRIGDVIDGFGAQFVGVWDLLNGPPVCDKGIGTDDEHGGETRHCYVKNLDYYRAQIAKLPADVRTVYLVAGSHVDMDFARSSEYIRGVRDFFLSEGFVVHMRLGGTPDDAFILAANARYFVVGGGGYSILMANVNEAMGGTSLSSPAGDGPRLMCDGWGCEYWDGG